MKESGLTENKSTYTSEAKDTSIKKLVHGVDRRVSGMDIAVNSVDKVVNGVQNGVHDATNGNVKFVKQNSVQSNSKGRDNVAKF